MKSGREREPRVERSLSWWHGLLPPILARCPPDQPPFPLHPPSPPPPSLQTELAESTAALFTRDGEQASALYDMQAQWYEVAAGRAYLAQRQHGKVCSFGGGEHQRQCRGHTASAWLFMARLCAPAGPASPLPCAHLLHPPSLRCTPRPSSACSRCTSTLRTSRRTSLISTATAYARWWAGLMRSAVQQDRWAARLGSKAAARQCRRAGWKHPAHAVRAWGAAALQSCRAIPPAAPSCL